MSLPWLLATALLSACQSGGSPAGAALVPGSGLGPPGADAGGREAADGALGPGDSGAGDSGAGDSGAGLDTAGLPCAVSALLSTYCVGCHGTTPLSGTPFSIVTYAQLTGPSPANTAVSLAENALTEMQAGRMPPTATQPSPGELAAFADWVNAGTPRTECASGGVRDPFAGASVCTSGRSWTVDDGEGEDMRPGEACVSCHARERGEAPTFNVGGTVYPTGREPDRCEGVKDVTVELTDANGRVFRYETNGAGNFSNHGLAQITAFPYTARLIDQDGKTRSMATPQSEGDCNGCHTERGENGAPGRIVMPL